MASPPPEHDPSHDEDLAAIVVGDPAVSAAGLAGVRHGLDPVRHQVGIRRGTRILRDLNQPDGFDCPGCAWPEPAQRARHAEFCENGAKAVAEEATTPTGRPRPSSPRHPIADLAERSDYWLGQQGRLTEPDVKRPRARPLRADLAGTTRSPLIAAAAAGRDDARPSRLLHVGAHQQRGGVPLPAVRAALRHEQPARLLEHVPRVERRARSTETIGIGKGTVTLDDFDARRPDPRRRPEPRHQPPPHAHRRSSGPRQRGAPIVAVNPLPEAGLLRVQEPADGPRACSAGAPPLADHYLPDPGQRRPRPVPGC